MMKLVAMTGVVVAALGLAGAGGPAAAAEEGRPQINAPMILNLMARPLESSEAARNRARKRQEWNAPGSVRRGPAEERAQEPSAKK